MHCPNCGDEVPGLFGSETGVRHCGCYHECRGEVHAGNDPEVARLKQDAAIERFWSLVKYGHWREA